MPVAEAALRQGFGPWDHDSPDAWGNALVDCFLRDLTEFCHNACRPPDLAPDTNAKPAATAWPLALVARAISSGIALEDAWGLTVTEAFYLTEAASEAKGHGTNLVGMSVKAAEAAARAVIKKTNS